MNLVINGVQVVDVQSPTVLQLLTEQHVQSPDFVSVELNGRILSRDEFGTTAVTEGDHIEFLYFMGGGHGVN